MTAARDPRREGGQRRSLHGKFSTRDLRVLRGIRDTHFSTDVLAKALLALSEGTLAVDQDKYEPRVWRALSKGASYRIQISTAPAAPWVTCTCPNGLALGRAKCYHAAAVIGELIGALQRVQEITQQRKGDDQGRS